MNKQLYLCPECGSNVIPVGNTFPVTISKWDYYLDEMIEVIVEKPSCPFGHGDMEEVK